MTKNNNLGGKILVLSVIIFFFIVLFLAFKGGYFSTAFCPNKDGLGAYYIKYLDEGYKANGNCGGDGGAVSIMNYNNGNPTYKSDTIDFYYNGAWLYATASPSENWEFLDYLTRKNIIHSEDIEQFAVYYDYNTGERRSNRFILVVDKDSYTDNFLKNVGFRTFYDLHGSFRSSNPDFFEELKNTIYRKIDKKYFDNETNYKIYVVYTEKLFEDTFNTLNKGYVCNATYRVDYYNWTTHRSTSITNSSIGKVEGVYCKIPSVNIPLKIYYHDSYVYLQQVRLDNFVVFKNESLAEQFGYNPTTQNNNNNNDLNNDNNQNNNNNNNDDDDSNLAGNVIKDNNNNGGVLDENNNQSWFLKLWLLLKNFFINLFTI